MSSFVYIKPRISGTQWRFARDSGPSWIESIDFSLVPQEVRNQIETINIDHDSLTSLTLNGFSNLTNLNITTPGIMIEINELALISDINFSGQNSIQTASITNCQGLLTLNLSLNPLISPPILSGLPNIQIINLNNTGLTIPPILTGLTELYTLNLNNNSLIIAPDVTGLTNLLSINIVGNSLPTIEVNKLLIEVDSWNTSNGFMPLDGNQSPSGAGIIARDNLLARGWVLVKT